MDLAKLMDHQRSRSFLYPHRDDFDWTDYRHS